MGRPSSQLCECRSTGGPMLRVATRAFCQHDAEIEPASVLHAAQHTTHPHHPHRQPAAAGGADAALRQALARRAGGSGRDRPDRPRRGARRRGEAARGRHRRRQQRRAAARLVLSLSAFAAVSGLGGSWTRPTRGDVDALSGIPEAVGQAIRRHGRRLQPDGHPEGDRRGRLSRRHGDQRRVPPLQGRARRKRRTHSPSRSCARRRPASSRWPARTSTTTRSTPISPRSAAPCRSNTTRSSSTAICCRSTRPTSRWSGTSPTRTSRCSAFQEFVEKTVATINDALANVPRDRVRLHVCWGNSESPHDRDVPLEDILPILQQGQGRRLRAAVRQSAARPRVQAVQAKCRSTTIRSWSPA